MESHENLVRMKNSLASVVSCSDRLEQHSNDVQGSESFENDLLEGLDSYMEDINERLTISRMVSDSVIKGMVNAVEQEAAERIAVKELEVAGLKETLHFYQMNGNGAVCSGSSIRFHEAKRTKYGMFPSVSDGLVEYDRMGESFGYLRVEAKEQLKKLKKEIDNMKGCSSIKKISSGSELMGLGEILQEKRWVDVDKTLDSLKSTLDKVYKQVDDMVNLSKASISEWQKEKEFQEEIEAMVIKNCIHSLQEEFEERLWDQNAHLYGSKSVNWDEKIKEISSLRQELDAVLKSLFLPELSEELSDSNRIGPFSRKVLTSHVSLPTSLSEGNGTHESKSIMPENLDPAQLKHMPKDDLINYFKSEITKMKRNHESKVHGMTEEYFSLKRQFFKERGFSMHFKKDKEFDILRKKIPEVVFKLDGILIENEKLPEFYKNTGSLGSLKVRLESLLSENRQLRDLLTDKKKKVKFLSSQVSNVAEEMSRYSLAEANMLRMVGKLRSVTEDKRIETSINEEIQKCVLREVICQIKCDGEKSGMEVTGQIKCDGEELGMKVTGQIMQERDGILLGKAAQNAEVTSKCEIQDTDMVSVIMQDLLGVIFREAVKDADAKLIALNTKYMNENINRVSVEMKALEKEKALSLEVEEKERLKQEILSLAAAMEEKENLALEVETALGREKERIELASQDLKDLRDSARRQRILISERSKDSDAIKCELVKALEHIDLCKSDMSKLNQQLELARKELRETDEEIRILHAVIQEKQNTLMLVEAKEKEHKKQMESVGIHVHELSKAVADFESRVTQDINTNSLRLKKMSSQLSSLIPKANLLKRTEYLYKHRLERRYSDLQKAEAEVDLLGDEVETLLGLLEKIYIALDHYSPILQHYPGVTEILKLIRRELGGESSKPV